MDTFQKALSDWLAAPGNTQAVLAEKVGQSQTTVHRWLKGDRIPDAETAREIDKATDGAIAFDAWQRAFLERNGLADAEPSADAA